jgi:hypothetical protein
MTKKRQKIWDRKSGLRPEPGRMNRRKQREQRD